MYLEASLQTGTDRTDPNPLPPPLVCSADNNGQKAWRIKLYKNRIVPLRAHIEWVRKERVVDKLGLAGMFLCISYQVAVALAGNALSLPQSVLLAMEACRSHVSANN